MPALPDQKVMGDLGDGQQGVVGVMSGPYKISLYPGALQALQDHLQGKFGPHCRMCFASSADTPFAEQIGRAALRMLEVVPGTTVWDLIVERDWQGQDVNQIGRQPPLSSNKAASHFPRLREITGIRYDRMLFMDDCNWGEGASLTREVKFSFFVIFYTNSSLGFLPFSFFPQQVIIVDASRRHVAKKIPI